MNARHFSGARLDWETPAQIFGPLNEEFNFDLDACATDANRKVSCWMTPEMDALSLPWTEFDAVWMNPPFSRDICQWVKKAYDESQKGCTVVCLLPARTDTAWWHDYCMKGEIRFIRGRVKFVGAKYNAPFPCAIVIFRGKP